MRAAKAAPSARTCARRPGRDCASVGASSPRYRKRTSTENPHTCMALANVASAPAVPNGSPPPPTRMYAPGRFARRGAFNRYARAQHGCMRSINALSTAGTPAKYTGLQMTSPAAVSSSARSSAAPSRCTHSPLLEHAPQPSQAAKGRSRAATDRVSTPQLATPARNSASSRSLLPPARGLPATPMTIRPLTLTLRRRTMRRRSRTQCVPLQRPRRRAQTPPRGRPA